MLIHPHFGIQIYCKNYSGKIVNVEFIEWSKIKNIFVNEALTIFRVVTYIVIERVSGVEPNGGSSSKSKKNEPLGDLIVPFKHFRLPMDINVEIVDEIMGHGRMRAR